MTTPSRCAQAFDVVSIPPSSTNPSVSSPPPFFEEHSPPQARRPFFGPSVPPPSYYLYNHRHMRLFPLISVALNLHFDLENSTFVFFVLRAFVHHSLAQAHVPLPRPDQMCAYFTPPPLLRCRSYPFCFKSSSSLNTTLLPALPSSLPLRLLDCGSRCMFLVAVRHPSGRCPLPFAHHFPFFSDYFLPGLLMYLMMQFLLFSRVFSRNFVPQAPIELNFSGS